MKDLKNKISGFLFVLSATVLFTAGQSLIKVSAVDVSVYHIIFWRGVIGIIVLLIIPLSRGSFMSAVKRLEKKHIIWLLFRGISGAVSMVLFFTALSMADLGEVGAFININPIFTVLFAAVLINEKPGLNVLLAVIIAVSGVFLIRNPFVSGFSTVHIIIFITAVLFGFAFTCIKKLKTWGVESWLVVLVFTAISFLVSVPGMLLTLEAYTLELFVYLVLVGIFTTVGQVFLTQSGKYIKAHSISIIALISVFEMMISGYLFFDEVITLQKVAGGLFIVAASVMVLLFRNKKA
jgi:drug/metabolite transporter (DMT)-like permease